MDILDYEFVMTDNMVVTGFDEDTIEICLTINGLDQTVFIMEEDISAMAQTVGITTGQYSPERKG